LPRILFRQVSQQPEQNWKTKYTDLRKIKHAEWVPMLLHCLLALTTTSTAAYQLAVAPLRTEQARQPRLWRRACPLFCEYAAGSAGSSDVHGAVDVGPERDVDRPALLDSSALLDALDGRGPGAGLYL